MKNDRPLNIMLYVISFFPTIGGREVVVHYLAKWLKRLGHNPRVVGPAGWLKSRKYKFEYPVHRWPTLRGRLVEQVKEASLLLDTKIWKTDLIHAHSTYPNGYFVSQLNALNKTPLIVTPHGEDIHIIPEINFGLRMDPVKDRKITQSLLRADACTAISTDVKNSLLDAGAKQEKIVEIPNGIDLERFDKKYSIDVRRKYNLPDDSLIVLSVASYHVKRGYEHLVDAFARVCAEVKNCYLLIAGRDTDVLMDRINSHGISANVKLLGQIIPPFMQESEDLLAAIYTQSNLYISSSMASGAEGLSLALMDGMGARLPIVATDISGNNDVVRHDGNGYLVRPGDDLDMANMIIKLLSDAETREKFGAASRETAAVYSWENITKRYIEVYRELIDRSA